MLKLGRGEDTELHEGNKKYEVKYLRKQLYLMKLIK